MATIKAFSDLEQSRKLAKILPLESADMHYDSGDECEICFGRGMYEEIADWICKGTPRPADIPCWSLAALLNVLPTSLKFKGDKYYLRFMKDYIEYANDEVSITGRCLHTTGNDNLIDACVAMIEKLHELKKL